MIVYHSTTPAAAQAIQEHGFLDGLRVYGSGPAKSGVVFTNVPINAAAGARGDALVIVELIGQDRDSLEQYRWLDPDHRGGHVEWLVPAEFTNSRAVIVNVEIHELPGEVAIW